MNNKVSEVLLYIRQTYSDDVIKDGQKFYALLCDLIPENKRELKIFKILCQNELLKSIISANKIEDINSIVFNLKSNYFLGEEYINEALGWFSSSFFKDNIELKKYIDKLYSNDSSALENQIQPNENKANDEFEIRPLKVDESSTYRLEIDEIFEKIKNDSYSSLFNGFSTEIKKIEKVASLPKEIKESKLTNVDIDFLDKCEDLKIGKKRNIYEEFLLAQDYTNLNSAMANKILGDMYSFQYVHGPKTNINVAVDYYLKAIQLGGFDYILKLIEVLNDWDYVQATSLRKFCLDYIKIHKMNLDDDYIKLYEDSILFYVNYSLGDKRDIEEVVNVISEIYEKTKYPTYSNLLGRYYLKEENFQKAISYFIKGCAKYNKHSLYYLGFCYYFGIGVNQNFKEAVHFFSLKDNATSPESKRMLSLCYYYGQGVEKSLGSAKHYLNVASIYGDKIAKTYFNDLLREKMLYLEGILNEV